MTPAAPRRIRTLLLAAGSGSRFGGDKLCVPLPDGRPLVLASAAALQAAGAEVLAVVRAADRGAGALLAGQGIALAVCPDAAAGLGHSLAYGVAASAGADGWLVALGDMPGIRPATIAAVLAALAAGAELVAPVWRGRRGHPVGFGCGFQAALLACRGDRGACDLIARAGHRLTLLDPGDPGVLRDLDRPADFARLASGVGRDEGPGVGRIL